MNILLDWTNKRCIQNFGCDASSKIKDIEYIKVDYRDELWV
jgi:hypothetical protein